MSAPLSDADLDAIEDQNNRGSGNSIVTALLAEVRRLRTKAAGWERAYDALGVRLEAAAKTDATRAAEDMRERAAAPLEDPQAMADALAEKSTHLVSWPNDRSGYTMGALTAIRERDRQWAEAIRALPVEPHK